MADDFHLRAAREAYLRTYTTDAKAVRAGKADWNGWIKGYVAALDDQATTKGAR